MTARRPARAAVLAGLLALAVVVVLLVDEAGDYVPGGRGDGANAWPSVQALLDGDAGAFFAGQPVMGPLSLLLRAPFAGLAEVLGGGDTAVYRAGAVACLAGPALVGTALYGVVARRGGPAYQGIVLAVLCVLNPLTFEAVSNGHPEEPLAGALAVGAVLVVARRPLAAGALTALAVATKQWTVLALPVVLAGARTRRLALGAVAVGLGAALLAPMTLADRDASRRAQDAVVSARTANAFSAWYPVSTVKRSTGDGVNTVDREVRRVPFGATRATVAPVIVVLSVVLSLLLWRRSGADGPGTDELMALLALLCILRCVLDPGNLPYYAAGSLLAVCAWEALARRGPPLIALLYAAASWAAYGPLLDAYGRGTASALFLALMAAFASVMALAAFAPGRVGSAA